jgi:hypothetical protein
MLLERVALQKPRSTSGLLAVADQLLQHPAAASMSCDTVSQVLGLFTGLEGVSSTVLRLLKLPAAQQLSSQPIRVLLWDASRQDYNHVCEVLCSLPNAAAVRDDPEVQAMLADDGCFWMDGVDERHRHVDREWCPCPRCSQL